MTLTTVERRVDAKCDILLGMSTLTSIKVPIEVRNQLRDAATRAGLTQSGLIEVLLNRFAEELFWQQMEETSSEEYNAILAADGDELNEDYTLEDALIDEEESNSLTGTKEQL